MTSVLVHLLFVAVLSDSLASDPAPPCRPRWLPFGQRCFAFFPVWSLWSDANSMCSQTGADLVSLHTPEERQFALQLANTNTPVWLGGYQQQNGSWFWSDGTLFRNSSWTNQMQGKPGEGGACMEMAPKSGELHSAPCGELRFYICSTRASSPSTVFSSSRKPDQPGIVSGLSLFDVVWSYSDLLVEEILHSSAFLGELWSGRLMESCYSSFMQQEALYLDRVSSTLEALIGRLQEADDLRSLLLDTLKHYSSRNQSVLAPPPPRWLHYALQSFHSLVSEEPVYWLVALSARPCLRKVLAGKLLHELGPPIAGSMVDSLYQDSLKEVAWIDRYRQVLTAQQGQLDEFKAINIFREHMMNQKSLYKAAACEAEDDDGR